MRIEGYGYYGGAHFGYDPWGKRVMKESNPDDSDQEGEFNPQWEFYFYTITGQRLVTMDCVNPNSNPVPSCWVAGENAYFGKKLIVSNGVYVVTDRLGSVRANGQGEQFAYYPYGEERTSTVDGREKFGTYFRDGIGQDYADQRNYDSGAPCQPKWFSVVKLSCGRIPFLRPTRQGRILRSARLLSQCHGAPRSGR
jgi:hypothetical protein